MFFDMLDKHIQKEHQRDTIKRKEKEIELLKNLFKAIYGEKI